MPQIHTCRGGMTMVPGEGYVFNFYIPPQDVSQIQNVLSHIKEVITQNIAPHEVMSVQYEPSTHLATVIVKAASAEPCEAVRDRVNLALAQATGGAVTPAVTPVGGFDWKPLLILGGLGLLAAFLLKRG